MSVNNTACSPTGTCPIMSGATTNGTDYITQYDPNAPVLQWRNRMELATIIVCNSLSLIVIFSRIAYRWRKLRRFRGDDRWMAGAAFFLVGLFISQIGTNLYGSGLPAVNVPTPWRALHWHYQAGWVGYWITVTCIKMSVCWCFLQILSIHHKSLRYWVYGLCTVIMSLGITMTFSYLFSCTPVLSNFWWNIDSTSCINYDIFRYLWIGLSIPIDIAILNVPIQFLRRLKLRTHERRILKLVFGATVLGTISCCVGIYGAFETRVSQGNQAFYQEAAFVMMSDIEILMYTLGASFPILSRYMVEKTQPEGGQSHMNFSSWARYVPDFFPSTATSSRPLTNRVSAHDDNAIQEAKLTAPSTNDGTSTCNTPDLGFGSSSGGYLDVEQAKIAHDNQMRIEQAVEGETFQEYLRNTPVIEKRW